VWKFYYPTHSQIQDPTPGFPPAIIGEINATTTRTVAYLRTTDNIEPEQAKRLIKAAADIFRLLSRERLEEEHGDVESLRQVLRGDAEAASKVDHWIYKQANNGGRMPYYEWHEGVERGLHEAAAQIETNWWTRKAEDLLTPPTTPAPVPTRAPRTETAHCIEAFLYQVKEKTRIEVDKTDFWLRPTKNIEGRTPRYSSDREFRSFQREDADLPPAVRRIFMAVLKMTPEKFVEGLEERRQWLKSKRKTKAYR
jgi:hypothetical protein